MAKKIIPLPSLSRVAPNSTALLELPVGPTYEKIIFTASGTGLTAANIGQMRVLVNGNTLRQHKDLTRLIDMNGYYGQSVDSATEFVMHFDRNEFHSLADERTPAFGTADLQTFTVEIDIPAGAPANIALSAQAFVETTPQPLGVYTRIREVALSSAVAGEIEYDKLQRGDKVYQAIHFFKSDITKVFLEADGFKIIDTPKTVLERLQRSVRPFARVPQTAKATHVDFNLSGDVNDLLQLKGVEDVRFKLTLGTAGTVEIVTEELSTEY